MSVTPTPPLVIMIEECQRRRLAPTAAEIKQMVDLSEPGGIRRMLDALEWFACIPLPDALHIRPLRPKEEVADLVTTRFYDHVAKAKARGAPVRRDELRQIILDCLP